MAIPIIIPKAVFLTRGVGVHPDELISFEMALRDAGIQSHNLVYVSSILPPQCKIISRNEGIKNLHPGQIIFCVSSRCVTFEPHRQIAAAIGLARPRDSSQYGYISEHHCYGWNKRQCGDYAEDLAAKMLASTLGIELDPETAWEEREKQYKASGLIVKTRNICQTARGQKGLHTTVIAVAVLL